jgi:hypothetical protein
MPLAAEGEPRYALSPAGTAGVFCLSMDFRRMPVQARTLASLLALGALLAGCAKPPPPVVQAPPLPPHLGPPPAAVCLVAPFHVADGGTAQVNMTVSNDGGYCAAALTNAAGQAFDAGLVPVKPAHGEDSVIKYNGKTSVEYFVKSPGYVGHDGFTVHLISKDKPGYTTLNVAVDVQPVNAGVRPAHATGAKSS